MAQEILQTTRWMAWCVGMALCALTSAVYADSETQTPPPSKQQTEILPPDLTVMGWVENVKIYPGELPFMAKLDTGATTSSIDALNVERFTDPEGTEWVRFTMETSKGKMHTLERKVERWVRIKKKGGGYVQRPVVKMSICVGPYYIEEEMNLSRRVNFNYQVLIGRNMLANHILVDSSKRRTQKPQCKRP